MRYAVGLGMILLCVLSALADEKEANELGRPLPYNVDFKGTQEGTLPDGWTGDDSVSVYKAEYLQAADEGLHEVRSPELNLRGDFELSLNATIAYRNKLEVTLEGDGNASDLALSFEEPVFADRSWTVTMNKGTPKEIKVDNGRADVRLERRGPVYRLIVNDETLVAKRMTGFGDFDRIELTLSGGRQAPVGLVEGTKVSELEVKPLDG